MQARQVRNVFPLPLPFSLPLPPRPAPRQAAYRRRDHGTSIDLAAVSIGTPAGGLQAAGPRQCGTALRPDRQNPESVRGRIGRAAGRSRAPGRPVPEGRPRRFSSPPLAVHAQPIIRARKSRKRPRPDRGSSCACTTDNAPPRAEAAEKRLPYRRFLRRDLLRSRPCMSGPHNGPHIRCGRDRREVGHAARDAGNGGNRRRSARPCRAGDHGREGAGCGRPPVGRQAGRQAGRSRPPEIAAGEGRHATECSAVRPWCTLILAARCRLPPA